MVWTTYQEHRTEIRPEVVKEITGKDNRNAEWLLAKFDEPGTEVKNHGLLAHLRRHEECDQCHHEPVVRLMHAYES